MHKHERNINIERASITERKIGGVLKNICL